jgi:ABC-type lipoprotein release transport system permease subunit
MALEKGRGRSAVPVRSTIIGTIVGVAAVATALTFGASIDHAVHTPYLQGVNWDGVIGDDFDPDDAAVVVPILQNDPSIEEFSAGGAGIVAISGQNVTAIGMQQVRGHIEPVILEGRAPYREDEVVLGVRTMREVHAAVGDTITVSTGPRSVRMRVVGKAVSPTIADEVFSGRGTFMTLEGLKTLVPNNSTDIYLFRVRDRAQLPQLTARLRAALPALAVGIGPKGGDVQELSRVRNLPLVLAGLLALLAIATLAHLIVTAVRTRGPQLAILKTLGFVRRQIRAVVAWQATTLAFVALVVAVPLGYIVGRLSWGVLADQMGFVSAPVIPAWELLSVVPGLVLAANLVAVLPARRAARTRPAVALRSE